MPGTDTPRLFQGAFRQLNKFFVVISVNLYLTRGHYISVIDYYHPACHYPNRVNYYALLSICRLAKEEWEERKVEYAHKANNDIRA